MSVPTIEEAIQHGIIDRTHKDSKLGIVMSYAGSVVFGHGLRRWSAIGHSAVIVDGKVIQNGYIEFTPMAPETESEKKARLAKEHKGFFSKLKRLL